MGVDLWRGLVISDDIFCLFVLLDDSESRRTGDKAMKTFLAAREDR